jgi:hypothetical protein
MEFEQWKNLITCLGNLLCQFSWWNGQSTILFPTWVPWFPHMSLTIYIEIGMGTCLREEDFQLWAKSGMALVLFLTLCDMSDIWQGNGNKQIKLMQLQSTLTNLTPLPNNVAHGVFSFSQLSFDELLDLWSLLFECIYVRYLEAYKVQL